MTCACFHFIAHKWKIIYIVFTSRKYAWLVDCLSLHGHQPEEHAYNILMTEMIKDTVLLYCRFCSPSYKATPSGKITWPNKGGCFSKEISLVVFYCLSASEIWPYNRSGLWWEWAYKRGRGATVNYLLCISELGIVIFFCCFFGDAKNVLI